MLMGFAPVNTHENVSGLQSLYKKAKQEGQVVWDGPYSPNQMASVIKKFERKYPGVTSFVHLFSLSDAVIHNKNKASKSQAPQTWDDLLKPCGRGSSRSMAGAAL